MSIFNSINNAFNTVSNSFNMVKAALSSLKTQPDSIAEQIKQDIIRQSKPINSEANQLLNIFGRFF